MPAITAVMIDSREPAWVQALAFGGAPKMVATLETGDVQAVTDDGCTLVFERKTLSDFLNSIADDRIFMQLARMSEIPNAWRYLMITDPIACDHNGNIIVPERGVTKWTLPRVMGAILSTQELGIHVVWCNGQLDYEDCILRIGKRNRSDAMHIAAPRAAKLLGPKIDFLTGLPGIGVEHAQRILEWAGDNVAHALTGLADLENGAPINTSVRKRIRALMGLQDGETLEIIGTQIDTPILEGQKING